MTWMCWIICGAIAALVLPGSRPTLIALGKVVDGRTTNEFAFHCLRTSRIFNMAQLVGVSKWQMLIGSGETRLWQICVWRTSLSCRGSLK